MSTTPPSPPESRAARAVPVADPIRLELAALGALLGHAPASDAVRDTAAPEAGESSSASPKAAP